MKILLVSDTHGNNQILEDLYRCYPKLDLYLHAGDSEVSEPMLISPFIAVRGNCDYNFDLPNSFECQTPRGKLVMKHVPHLREAEKKYTRIFLHGHTHKSEVRVVDNILYICPGSLCCPRDGHESYMLLNIRKDKLSIVLREASNHKVIYKKEFVRG